MDYSIYKIYDTPEENAQLFEQIVLYYNVYNIYNYKKLNDEIPFYGTVENYIDKCSTVFNKAVSKEEYCNNWVFYTRFSFPPTLLEIFFEEQLDDILNIIKKDETNTVIIVDPKRLFVKVTENRQSTYRRFVTPKCFIIDIDALEKICCDEHNVDDILNLDSNFYTEKDRILIKRFIKKRNQFLKDFYKKDEKISLTKTKETKHNLNN